MELRNVYEHPITYSAYLLTRIRYLRTRESLANNKYSTLWRTTSYSTLFAVQALLSHMTFSEKTKYLQGQLGTREAEEVIRIASGIPNTLPHGTCEIFTMSIVRGLLSSGASGSRTAVYLHTGAHGAALVTIGGHTMFLDSSIHHAVRCPEGKEYLYSVDTHPPHFKIFPNPPSSAIHAQSSIIRPFLGQLMHTPKGSSTEVAFSVVDEAQMYSRSLRNSLSNPSIVCLLRSTTGPNTFIAKVEVDLRNVVATVEIFGRPRRTFSFMNVPQAEHQGMFWDVSYAMKALSKSYPVQFTLASKKEIQNILLLRLKML
jgi:hypothetical protein